MSIDKPGLLKDTYLCGVGEINNLAEHVKIYGTRSFILMDSLLIESLLPAVGKSYSSIDSTYKVVGIDVKGRGNLHRLAKKAEVYDHIIGIGNDSTLDLARKIACRNNCPFIIVPFITFKVREADMVIGDQQAIAEAPRSYMVKGIENTLSIYFDLRAAIRYSSVSMNVNAFSMELIQMEKCYKQILENGVRALKNTNDHSLTPELKSVIRACLYINRFFHTHGGSDIHSEFAVIHAVRNGLVALKEDPSYCKEEGSSFAILVLLVLENASTSELFNLLSFFWELDLPIMLEQIGIRDIHSLHLKEVANSICAEKKIFGDKCVTPAEIAAAIVTADSIGKQYYLERSESGKSME